MEHVIDPNRVYSTLYTSCEGDKCLQKAVVIGGVSGKQIKIEKLSASLYVVSAGTTGTLTVTAQETGGAETILAKWIETKTTYQEKNESVGFLAGTGKSVILRWYLITSKSTVRSRFKLPSYTYSLVDVPAKPVIEDVQCAIWIACKNEIDAKIQIEDLKAHVGDREIGIYLKQ